MCMGGVVEWLQLFFTSTLGAGGRSTWCPGPFILWKEPTRRLGVPQSRFPCFSKRKNILTVPGFEARILQPLLFFPRHSALSRFDRFATFVFKIATVRGRYIAWEVSTIIDGFWHVTRCRLVNSYRHFEWSHCLHFQTRLRTHGTAIFRNVGK
jgi:hypothetical protein